MNYITEKNNKVYVYGEIVSDATFSHEVYGEGFYEFFVRVMRLSGQADILPVTLSERLIQDGSMSGYVALLQGCGRSQIFGYCNCGPKEKYVGIPEEWRTVTAPDGARVFAIVELLIAPAFRDCGLEEKLVAHTLAQAKKDGFTHAQVYLWDSGVVDENENCVFDHFLALYTAMGFTVHADISCKCRREYVLQKEL